MGLSRRRRSRLVRTGPSHPTAQTVPVLGKGRLSQVRPAPKVFPQHVARGRRRKGLGVQYSGDFDLVAELQGILFPIAVEVSEVLVPAPWKLKDKSYQGNPPVFGPEVATAAEAVHELRASLVDLLRVDPELSAEGRARLAATVGSSAPVVTVADLKSREWVDLLVAHVAPLAGDVADLLGRSAAPEGWVSGASEALVDALRPLDRAARLLAQKIPKVREFQDAVARRQVRDARRAEERRAREVARLLVPPAAPQPWPSLAERREQVRLRPEVQQAWEEYFR